MVGINRGKLEEINIVSLIKVANKNILYSCPFITEDIVKELINKKCDISVELNYAFIDSIDSLKLVMDLISNNIKVYLSDIDYRISLSYDNNKLMFNFKNSSIDFNIRKIISSKSSLINYNNIKEIIESVKFNEYNKIVNELRNFIKVVYIDISGIKVFEKEVSISNIIKQNNKTRPNQGTTGIKVFSKCKEREILEDIYKEMYNKFNDIKYKYLIGFHKQMKIIQLCELKNMEEDIVDLLELNKRNLKERYKDEFNKVLIQSLEEFKAEVYKILSMYKVEVNTEVEKQIEGIQKKIPRSVEDIVDNIKYNIRVFDISKEFLEKKYNINLLKKRMPKKNKESIVLILKELEYLESYFYNLERTVDNSKI